ncbi:MAG: hypothetical protein N2512_07950 [Armatimonadetes bacterium]|nr:hypothetical protein [Armatimonadota bacterium]
MAVLRLLRLGELGFGRELDYYRRTGGDASGRPRPMVCKDLGTPSFRRVKPLVPKTLHMALEIALSVAARPQSRRHLSGETVAKVALHAVRGSRA